MKDVMKFVMEYVERKGKLPKDADINIFNYVKSGHIDSLALFKFVVEIEAEFDIEISDEDLISPGFATIGGLVSLINEKRNPGSAGVPPAELLRQTRNYE